MKLVNLTASELDLITELLIVERMTRWAANGDTSYGAVKEDVKFADLINKLLAASEELTHQYAN